MSNKINPRDGKEFVKMREYLDYMSDLKAQEMYKNMRDDARVGETEK